MPNKKPSYKVLPVVSSDEVPGWARRPPKWNDLIEQVLKLKVGETMPVVFEDAEEAKRARETVRDRINREKESVVLGTRIVKEGEKTVVYFTRNKE